MDCISPWLLKLLTDHSAVRGGLKLLEVANTGGKCHAGVLLRSAYTSGTAKGRGSSILDVLCGHALSGFGTRTKTPGIWDDRSHSVSKHRVLTSLDTIATVCYILDDLTTSIKDSVSRDDIGGSSSQDLQLLRPTSSCSPEPSPTTWRLSSRRMISCWTSPLSSRGALRARRACAMPYVAAVCQSPTSLPSCPVG